MAGNRNAPPPEHQGERKYACRAASFAMKDKQSLTPLPQDVVPCDPAGSCDRTGGPRTALGEEKKNGWQSETPGGDQIPGFSCHCANHVGATPVCVQE